MASAAIPILSSIAPIGASYEAWLVDIWGVLHNGAEASHAAAEACRHLRGEGGTVVLISNAPRPFTAVIDHLDRLGVPRDAYDDGVTSGDVTRAMIADWQGRPLLHVGPERDKGLFADFDVTFAEADKAEVVICSGLYDDTRETPADYESLFDRLLARRVPMICANPDLLVERGNHLVYCAGSLAAAYQAKGGEVTQAGKPYAPIYERALGLIERLRRKPVARESILAIGDGIETDLLGAFRAGLPSIFVSSGVHVTGALDQNMLRELFTGRPFTPLAALPALVW